MYLVSRAVGNRLKPENVTVTDEFGKIISDFDDDFDKAKTEFTMIEYRKKIEEKARVKLLNDIREGLERIYSADRIQIVRLNMDFNWDKISEEQRGIYADRDGQGQSCHAVFRAQGEGFPRRFREDHEGAFPGPRVESRGARRHRGQQASGIQGERRPVLANTKRKRSGIMQSTRRSRRYSGSRMISRGFRGHRHRRPQDLPRNPDGTMTWIRRRNRSRWR